MNTETQTSNELQIVIDQNGLEQETRIALKNAFDPFYIQASEWKSKALALTVTDASQIKEMVDAREARLALGDSDSPVAGRVTAACRVRHVARDVATPPPGDHEKVTLEPASVLPGAGVVRVPGPGTPASVKV